MANSSKRLATAWFDEGLPIHLSGDSRYSKPNWHVQSDSGRKAANIEALITSEDWINARKQDKATYIVMRMEVKQWLDKVGNKGLMELIRRVRFGEGFQGVYDDIYAKASLGSPEKENGL